MIMENSPIRSLEKTVACPVPSAGPEEVAHWLRKMRIGALCGLAVVISHAVYWVLGTVGIAPSPGLANTIACMIASAGGLGVWLLVAAEPHNRKWLWPCRWALRLAAGTLIVLCVAPIVLTEYYRNLPEQTTDDILSQSMGWVVGGGWLIFYWYLKELSHRLGDRALRKNFTVLFWIISVVLFLSLATLTCDRPVDDGNSQSPSATVSGEASTSDSGGASQMILMFAIWIAYCIWEGWLMWRLSKRLHQAAGHYQKLCADPAVRP